MLTVRPAEDRGHANHGWLDTYHTFSFADYYDPGAMGFRALRVINEDRIAAGRGFGSHPHRDMEIITYVLEGALEHRDSLGSGGVVTPGEVQHMSAGRGIRHSEANGLKDEPLHLLQIWLMPDRNGVEPKYGQKVFPIATEKNKLHLVASSDGRDGSLPMETDADLYAGQFEAGAQLTQNLRRGYGWLQVARGSIAVKGLAAGEGAGLELKEGDGLSLSAERTVEIEALQAAEFLLFDLA